MKQGMTSVDMAALAAELRGALEGARLEKAYQPEKDVVLLRMRRKGSGRADLVFHLGRFVTIARSPPANPDKPSMVAQVLRSTLGNGRVVGIEQVGFDRILRIDVERGDGRHALVLEVFGDGNLLLLDGQGTIVLPMRGTDYAARRLRRGEPYVPPPGDSRPLELDLDQLRAAGAAARRDVVRMLAVELGVGPQWAQELCLRAGVAKDAEPAGLDDAQWRSLHAELSRLGAEIRRNDLAPVVVYEQGVAVDAVPFAMRLHDRPGIAVEEAPSFTEALDTFFLGGAEAVEEDPRQARYDEAMGKLRRQEAQVAQAIERFGQEEQQARQRAEALYASFADVQHILEMLGKARQSRSWQEVAQTLQQGREAGNAAAMMVPELRPDSAGATLAVQDAKGERLEVDVDLRLSVQENADKHYEAAKRARRRAEGAATALADARRRIAELEARGLDGFGAAPVRREEARRHFWFETYRWTLTPGGMVAVGGRNAAQNDAVVKKYLRDGDRYVHAEIHGAPSVVLRPVEGAREAAPEDLQVACAFAACASRAWRQFGSASAYWVTPQQVSKTPRSGEFVPRGAWIVHGRRNTLDGLPMAWAAALVRFAPDGTPVPAGQEVPHAVTKLAGGPEEGLRPWALRLWRMAPGDVDLGIAAQRLAEAAQVSVEEAQAALPPGPVSGLEEA